MLCLTPVLTVLNFYHYNKPEQVILKSQNAFFKNSFFVSLKAFFLIMCSKCPLFTVTIKPTIITKWFISYLTFKVNNTSYPLRSKSDSERNI